MARKPLNPWWMPIGAGVAQIVGQGPVTQFTFGVFLKPITVEFGWNRGAASVALTIGVFLTAFTVPLMGGLMDRFGVRKVALISAALFGLCLMAVGAFARSPLAFVLLYAVTGLFAAGQTPLPYAKAIAVNFDRWRGAALAISMAGVGVGTIILPQVAGALIAGFGWRVAYIVIGALVLIIALPIMAFLVGPAAARGSARAEAEGVGVSMRDALRDPRFYLLAAALALSAGAANGAIAHVAPLLMDRGVPMQAAVGAIGLVGISAVVGRLIAGYALDRLPGGLVAALFLGAAMAGVLLLAASTNLALATVAVLLLGLGLGAETDLAGFLVARYFGARYFGEIFGYMFGAFLLASSVGPAVMGLWFQAAGSYTPCLLAFAACLFIAVVLFQRLGPYVYTRPAAVEA